MAETMALALEGRFGDYTIGKEMTLERVNKITQFRETRFRPSRFRSFVREVTEEQINLYAAMPCGSGRT